MKMTSLAKLIVLTSATLFTACSTTSPKPTKTTPPKLTTSEILGIDDTHPRLAMNDTTTLPIKRVVRNEITNLPMARTYPMESSMVYESEPMARTYPMESPVIYGSEPMARTYPIESPVVYRSEPVRTNSYIQNYLTVANNVEYNAKSLLGIKYVWGATGPYTYDCSGFTQKVYRDAGINIPRVSRDQARVGQYIPFNALRRGDMVFFDTHKRRSGKVTHVGIYLGNNNFIHASSAAKKVVIFNFDEKPYYKKRFLWGRRVIRDNYYMASI